MANYGDSIKWSSFSHSAARSTYVIGGKGADVNCYMYISACSFEVRLHVVGAFLATAELRLDFWYYNWNTSTWVSAGSVTASARGKDATDNRYFYHNWNGSNSSSDGTNYHLWKVHVVTINTGGQRHIEADFTPGGPGCMSESQYNSICKNKFIVSAGRLGGDWLHSTSITDDATALSYFRWSNNTGTLITASNADKCIPKSWV